MQALAQHHVDYVLPRVPVRQWVLSLPHSLRYRLAYDHDLCSKVLACLQRALGNHYRAAAAKRGNPDGLGASAYSWGWARFVPWPRWLRLLRAVARVERPLQGLVFAVELLAPLALLHPLA